MGPVRVWCQWWNAGVETSHSSGPNRHLRLAWMKNPQSEAHQRDQERDEAAAGPAELPSPSA